MNPIKLVAQLDRITTTRDGGGKLTLEFGADSLSAIHELQTLNGTGDTNLMVVIVPFEERIASHENPFEEWVANLNQLKK